MLAIVNNDLSPEAINKTFIVLIPKGKISSSLKDHQAIILYNIVMKIVTNAIANRIKYILPDIIDAEQSAFVYII